MTPSTGTQIAVLSQGRAAVYEEPIGPAGVRVRERPRTEPAEGAVAIAIRAASINHLDLFMAHGLQRDVKPPRVIAADGAGVVAASTSPDWRPGDEVVVYPVVCDWECEWCRAGENVRCLRFGVMGEHSAGTAVAAIRIARHLGARVFATSRSEVKRKKALEIGVEAVFDSSDFSKPVREATGGGVDVVFEHVGPATLQESMRSVKMGGRVVTCGSTSGVKAEIMMPRLFWGQMDLLGSTMGNVGEFQAVLKAIDDGLRPVVDSVHPLNEVQDALTRL